MTAITIDLTGASMDRAGVQGWALKRDAAAHLAKLRETGRNLDRCIEIHPAYNRFRRFYVIGRPDDLAELTWLMDRDGTWATGRLYDDVGDGAPWEHLPQPGGRIPATITHAYRYSAGSEEVIEPGGPRYGLLGGRLIPMGPRLDWFAKAWCIACDWRTSDTDEHSVRARARGHRDEMQRQAEAARNADRAARRARLRTARAGRRQLHDLRG